MPPKAPPAEREPKFAGVNAPPGSVGVYLPVAPKKTTGHGSELEHFNRSVNLQAVLAGQDLWTFERVRDALRDGGAKLRDGKPVYHHSEVIRYILERIDEQLAGQ